VSLDDYVNVLSDTDVIHTDFKQRIEPVNTTKGLYSVLLEL